MNIYRLAILGTTALTLSAVPALAQQRMDSNPSSSAPSRESAAPRTGSSATQSNSSSQSNRVLTVIENGDAMVQPYNISVDKLEGMDVIGANGQKIGDVEDVLADQSGKAVAVSIDAGSFLEMNSKEVIMQLSTLQMRDDKLHTSMTKDQISALPDHND